MKLTTLGPRLVASDSRRIAPAAKATDRFYLTPEYEGWREKVIAAAGRRCEWVVSGQRCRKAAPYNRMFADHKVERRDGGEPYDVANGQCLCGAHHSLKTAQARAARLRARP